MAHKLLVPALALSLVVAAGCRTPIKPSGKGVAITQEKGKLRVEVNGQFFTDYIYTGAPRPYMYPLIAHGGQAMTRNWPMKDVAGEDHDHPHHRSVWYGHRNVNGHSFWEETGKEGTIKHEGFDEVKGGKDFGTIKARHSWISKEGELICTDTTTVRVYNRKNDRMMDFDITITAPKDKEVVMGDDKDGAMSTRIAESMRLTKLKQKGQKKGDPGDGHIVLSTGIRDGDTWGKRADWCDYYGPVDGKIVGVAIFDHPSNPRHPTWWHVRDYGLFGANPFGQHYFENLPDKNAGDMKIAPGKSVTFRYRFYWHDGDEKSANVAGEYSKYAR